MDSAKASQKRGEQFEAYSTVTKGIGRQRSNHSQHPLDVGGDKDIRYLNIEKEENLSWATEQFAALIIRAFKATSCAFACSQHGNIKIMLPLITCVEVKGRPKPDWGDARKNKSEGQREYRSVDVGIMFETPAAVFISDNLAREVKFSLSLSA